MNGDIMLSIVNRVFHEFFDDSIPTVAGGITFFFLLAIFPAIASIVSLYGMIADRSTYERLTSANGLTRHYGS